MLKPSEFVLRRGLDPAFALFDELLQLSWTCDSRGALSSLSPRWEAYTGKPCDQLVGHAWLEVIHPEDLERVLEAWKQAAKRREPFTWDYRLRRHDGAYRWFVARGLVMPPVEGQPEAWFGFSTDSHEMFEARQVLEREQERLVRIADVSPYAFYSFELRPDGSASFPYVSKAFRALYGEATDEVLRDGMHAVRLVHPDDLPGMVASMQRSQADLSVWHYEWRARVPGRGEVWLEGHSVPVPEADRRVTFHGVMVDITERKRREAQIEQLNDQLEGKVKSRTAALEAANRELEGFTSSVSHDLRAPLRAINGFAQALVEDYGPQLPEGAHRYLDTVQQGARRMGRLIDDLLSFGRLSRQPFNPRRIDTGALVAECLRELRGDSTARIVVHPLPASFGDASLLRHVWLQLLSNALKFSKPKSDAAIEVGAAETPEGDDAFFVRDNGVGFNMQYVGKLFGVFQRLHRSDDFEGTGVGLAIVERMVHRHGGRVWGIGEVGVGATFSFTLGAEAAHAD